MIQGEGLGENLKINEEGMKAKQKGLWSTGEREKEKGAIPRKLSEILWSHYGYKHTEWDNQLH